MTRIGTYAGLGLALIWLTGWTGCQAPDHDEDPACTPAAEVCNGQDDDCDGAVDEDFAVGEDCTAGVGACLANGALRCTEDGAGVACDAVAGEGGAELCDQLDNDCDGSTDEGLTGCCTPSAQQACGVTRGICLAGSQTCSGEGAWGACLSGGDPVTLPGTVAESCNDLDDDCDGATDEGLAGPACDLQEGVCAGSTATCAAGNFTCSAARYGPYYQATETSCDGRDNDCDGTTDEDCAQSTAYVADHLIAREAVLRAIPSTYIDAARTTLHVAYQHTSHGTHVAYGVFGLPGFEAGDATRFGVTLDAGTPDPAKLDFQDNEIDGSYWDLSQADADWAAWRTQVRTYLLAPANARINVMMWSWCDITDHSVADYLSTMQALIDEFGPGGTGIGSGANQRANPVTFIFMTGHAVWAANTGVGHPREQAALITDYCNTHGYYCIDYYSIDSHALDGTYYEDVGDDCNSALYGGNFCYDWQTDPAHPLGADWYENRTAPAPAGTVEVGAHNSQHITANRKAFAFWWVLARIAGYAP